MFSCEQLRKLIIQPVLQALDLYKPEDQELLVGTCAQESKGGTFLFQNIPSKNMLDAFNKGIFAIGIYQMEPKTHDDIWKNYLTLHVRQKPNRVAVITEKMRAFCKLPESPTADMMLYNLYYATAMARLHYYRVAEAIPTSLEAQAEYYKKYYNTVNGAATVDEYILNYRSFTGKR